ncbi:MULTISPECIES: DUF1189 domain-containing protein [Metabacillus]|uniref:DUF1189 domain-containing protein n=2 Tax=Metabacillus TaxID=2675233 RepID=A0A179SU68_9BACI|nr:MULTISPECIES: DUF1189 domain-containing protein [Metabacillus]OAS85061.1 hypothetical protein A6K24_05995 [Metabacillus litoralis]QNF26249.1 DUF1189 domain-containing protein [Metabacillus sp. KUDC1714]
MNVFKQLYTSIYSPKIISTFRFQGIGKTILFVFILSLISTIPTAFHFTSGLTEGLKGFDQTLRDDLPSFTIKDGQLSADTDKAIEIRKDNFIIILDDTGAFGVDEIENKQNAIGILQDRFVFAANGQAQSYEYNLLNMTISKQDLIDISKQFNQLLPIFISILVVIVYLFSSFVKFIEVTVLAVFGLAFKNSLQRRLNFKQIWVISAYSTTLATIFFIIMDSLQVTVPNGFLLNWFVHLIVLYLVIKEVPPSKKPLKTA